MKKITARTVLLTLLVAASLASYIFLNTTSSGNSAEVIPLGQSSTELLEDIEDLDRPEREILLPDVHLLKKVVESGKRFLPAS